jgi:two-component system phosphate regulon sensor histidine kinase PhoR
MPSRSWKFHTAWLILAAAAVLIAGWITGHPGKIFLAAFIIYTLWHVINILILHHWLQNPAIKLSGSFGIWADIFNSISNMEQKNVTQKEQYQSMIHDFQTLTDAFPDATLVVDENANMTWFNRAAGSLLGLVEPDDIGRPVTALIRNPEFAEWLDGQGKVDGKLEMPTPGRDETWLDVSAVPIRENQSLLILRDISELHNVERIRRDFVTNVSHELRTPLTVMLGYLEIFQNRAEDELSDPLRRMHAQAVQMQFMLDDFLELSRLQAVESDGEEEVVDIAGLLRQLREQAEEISRGNHQLRFEIESKLGLFGISSDLESAFRNLIVNALKYTPEGGSISVSWSDSGAGPTLSVVDTGIGIPSREIPRLTERFYRVGSDRGRKSGGTGLGLAIVKHVLNEHQARLEISSEYGVGSQFICVFPRERRRT